MARLRRAIADPAAREGARADLGSRSAKRSTARSAYDDAFAAYAARTGASRQSAEQYAGRYDQRRRRAPDRPPDRRLSRAWADRRPAAGTKVTYRSSSAACSARLDVDRADLRPSHRVSRAAARSICCPRSQLNAWMRSPRMRRSPVEAARLRAWRERCLVGLEQLFPGAAIVTDKAARTTPHIGLITATVPRARICAHAARSVDTLHRDHFTHLALEFLCARPSRYRALVSRQYRRLMSHWKRAGGAEAIPRCRLRRARADAAAGRRTRHRPLRPGLGRRLPCLPQETTSVVRTPSVWQVRLAAVWHSSGRWRNYEGTWRTCAGHSTASRLNRL